MSEKKFEECYLRDATHVEVNGKMYKLEGKEVVREYYHNDCIGLRWYERDAFIPLELFSTLGIKPLFEHKPKPIEFEFIPSLEMVKGSWLGEHIPMEAIGKKFKCVEILGEGK